MIVYLVYLVSLTVFAEYISGRLRPAMGLLELRSLPGGVKDPGADFLVTGHTYLLLLNHDGSMLSGTYTDSDATGTMRARGF